MAKTSPNRNISRIDIDGAPGTKGTHGYQVRLMRRGKATSKFFSDTSGKSKSPGKTKALAAARRYRDETIDNIGPSATGPHTTPSSRNTSGMIGVRRREAVNEGTDFIYYHYFWEGSWSDEHGARQKRNFSVNKYGEEEAKGMAIAARKKGIAATKHARKKQG